MFNPVTARLSSSTLRNFFLTYRVQIMVALLAVCALILMTQASAAGSNPFDTAFQAQGQKGCGWIASFVSSVLVRIVFFGMAIAGFVMGLARARGGWALAATGVVGSILSLQAIPIAKQLGLVPDQCNL